MWEKEADKHLGEEHRPVAAVEGRILPEEKNKSSSSIVYDDTPAQVLY
jgi:hypothetical protein